MKSKNPKIQSLTKMKKSLTAAIILIVMFLSVFIISYKKEEILLGIDYDAKTSSITVSNSNLGTEGNATHYNKNVNIFPDINDKNIRYVELLKKDSKGNWVTYTSINNEKYKYLLGDVNGDSQIDPYDAALIWGYLAGEVQLNSIQKLASDINGDGLINSSDMQIILYSSARYIDNEGNECLYFIGNPDRTDSIGGVSISKECIIDMNDSRIVYRIYCGYEDMTTIDGATSAITNNEKALLTKMLCDHDIDFQITYDEVRLITLVSSGGTQDYPNAIKQYEEENEPNRFFSDKVRDITYLSSKYVQLNTDVGLLPEVAEEGEYCFKTYSIQEEHGQATQHLEEMAEGILTGNTGDGYSRGENTYYFTIEDLAPTVTITADEMNPTNESGIIYKFRFSEKVEGFTADDITVNNGEKGYLEEKDENGEINKVINFKEIEEGLEYTLVVWSAVTDGNEGMLQVIVEEGVCRDLAGNSNIRQENTITIDRKAPKLEDCLVESSTIDAHLLLVGISFNEDVQLVTEGTSKFEMSISVDGQSLEVNDKDVGGITSLGRSLFGMYVIDSSYGGKVEISFKGKVKDIAGNESDYLEFEIENDIVLERKNLKNGNCTYKFEKAESENSKFIAINNLDNLTYFKAGNVIKVIQKDANNNEIVYKHTISSSENGFMKYMKLIAPQNGATEGTIEFYTTKVSGSIDISEANIYFDTINPNVEISIDVEEKNEEEIYTQGKELIITLTTSEAIQNEDKIPELNVSFSESGLGKYNYQGANAQTGNAKYVETIKNADGSITWKYKYIVEKGDNGKIQISYAKEEIIADLAGNEITLEQDPEVRNGEVNLENQKIIAKNAEGKQIEIYIPYEIYKNNKQITDFTKNTYFSDGDKIKIIAKFSNVLKSSYGSTNTYVSTSTAPILSIDGIEFEAKSIANNKDIIYEYVINGDSAQRLDKITLKFKQVLYAENENDHYTISANTEVVTDISNCNLHIYKRGTNINESNIIIDTEAPTVIITADKSNPTNANEIIYTFKFSEKIEGFTIDDITVNNGNKGEFKETEEGLEYTLVVNSVTTDGNEGTVEVIVEEGVCKDLVGQSNVRQENIITVDKVKPTFTSYEINEETGKIIVIATFGEALSEVSELEAKLTIGGNPGRGTWENTEIIENNKAKFVYNKDGSDGGKVELSLVGTVKDIAGNVSEKLNIKVENNIVYAQTVIKDIEGNIYSFAINGKPINDFTNPTYFVNGDTITVTKLDSEGNVTIYEKTITENDKYEDNTHIKYMNLTNPKQGETKGTVEFSTTKKSESIDITEANIYFDTTNPNVEISIYAEEKNEDEIYTQGKEIIITVATSEAIQNEDEIPQLNISFSESGLGKYNYQGANAQTGNAKYVETIKNLDGSITWKYKYVIEKGDNGKIEIGYAKEETIVDLAGNESKLEQYSAVNETNIVVDTVAPTVTITASVENATNSFVNITNNITNAGKLLYTFTWSEEVEGFTIEDITINNGTTNYSKLENAIDENGEVIPNVYLLEVIPSVENGNNGEVKIIVEQNACQDKVGLSNIRTENVVTVDRIAPIFISLEAYATSNISVNSNVDTVKEYYKVGDTITVVATFTENIENSNVPTLNLQFNESGNAKGTISKGIIVGNKITYTYTITDGDTGLLFVKGFSGTVADNAGNETKVSKKALEGDTIIADTRVPNLKELKVVAPNKGVYKAGETIKIEAIYDEEIYALENNVIKLITSDNAPVLKLKFDDNGAEKTATAVGYGITDGKEDRTKIEYKYTIVDGDNGILKLISYTGKTVCDIAGNVVTLGVNQTGNEIEADTIRPTVDKIEAKVEDSLIKGINGDPSNTQTGYYKVGNEVKITLTFSEPVSGAVLRPAILVGFSENPDSEPTTYNTYAYESDWNVNSTTIEYSYTIKDGDNGYLWIKVPEKQFADEAGNGNVEKTADRLENIFADTTDPTLTIYRDTEVIQDGQRITVKATFSENVYNLVDDERKTFIINNDINTAPIMIYGFGENGNLEAKAEKVEGNVITYVITKENTVSGEFYHAYFKGNVYDRAGNPCFRNDTDTIAPVLESVVISTNAGIYHPYCKTGTEIYVTATFDEPIKVANIKLKAKVGEVEISELDGTIVEEYPYQVKFTYTVKEGDMEAFQILDVCGNKDNTITEENADNTYGYVQDEHGNQKNIYSLASEGITVSERAEADTKAPYITSIRAISNDKEIATYTKEEGKEPVITVGRTNGNIVEYIVTYSEKVPYSHFENILITNGVKRGDVEYTNSDLNEYKITVQTTVEGVQSLIINEGTVEDKAGNIDGFVRFDAVTTDFTKPTVRFISEYNGGVYVIPTSIGKVQIRTNVEINEDISKIEYKWDEEDYEEITKYSSTSDIVIPTKEFNQSGEYTLYIKVTDIAGNVTISSKEYGVEESQINIEASNYEPTNQDVIVTVEFEEGLTDNKKVAFKIEGLNEYKEIVPNTDGTYTITENGTVYAEATDKVGNKVVEEEEITNIDREAPVIEFSEVPYGILKNEPVEVYIFTNEYAEIKYSWDNENWQAYTDKVTKSFEDAGEYTLYAKATDEAGNESPAELTIYVSALEFEVYGNTDYWTAGNVELEVSSESEITKITLYKVTQEEENKVETKIAQRTYSADTQRDYIFVIEENGTYKFTVEDTYGNTANKEEIVVDKIDKVAPVISNAENTGKEITITATDIGSGIAKYAISKTTETPVEWSESKVIKVTEDGTFYVWVKDNVGNVTRAEEVIIVDTTAPTIRFDYTVLTVVAGMPIEANIVTDEEAKISYSWDEKEWVDSEEFITSVRVDKKYDITGKYTLYAKAIDKSGNESKSQIEFTVTKPEDVLDPQIVFEGLYTTQIDGVHYVKVSPKMTTEEVTNKMKQEELCGVTPEYIKLADENKLKTGSEITLNGDTKYIVVVKGDINSDGKAGDFIADIIALNRYRIKKTGLTMAQILAGDINDDGVIDFIDDIMKINRYRIGIISNL